jgi:MbtH protein
MAPEWYVVVVNGVGQYSVWPCGLAVPGGWTEAGFVGSRADCLAHVARVWTDPRPAAPRQQSSAPVKGADRS